MREKMSLLEDLIYKKKQKNSGYMVTRLQDDVTNRNIIEKSCNPLVTNFEKKLQKQVILPPKETPPPPENELKNNDLNMLSLYPPKPEKTRCRACNSVNFWHLPGQKNLICVTCHPPATEKAIWIDPKI
jgi:hypothetical protein